MTTYTVYQFTETGETCVLPTCWVNGGQVKYDSRKSAEYAKMGKTPYKKWPSYKVERICDHLFDSYDAAFMAELVLLEKSDLESVDIKAIDSPTQILDKKRRRETVVPNSNSNYGCNDETEIKYDHLTYTEPSVELNPPFGDVSITDDNKMVLPLSTENQVNELKELILAQNRLIQQQNTKIDNLSVLVTNMSRELKKLKRDGINNVMTVTRWAFPMQTLDDVKELDESLKNAESGSVNEFKSFLLQLGGTTLKTTIKFIIKELYSLELQQRFNYSGREGKFSTKDLLQTKLILEVMQLNTGKTQVEAINEYMYHLQHVTDRIRALTKKIK